MSHVANIMVSVAYDDIPTVGAFSESLRTDPVLNIRRPIGSLTEITGENHGWGGYKLWMLRDGELRQYAPVSPLESD